MITLRPYQSVGIQQIRDAFLAAYRRLLYVLPTGGGKTVLFSAIAESSERRARRVLIMAHRIELVDQIVASLRDFDVTPDVIAASYQRTAGRHRVANRAVAVASVSTLASRLERYAPPTMIVCDEAHHVRSDGQYDQIFRAYYDARVLGVTATPIRLDGRGLLGHFDHMIVGPTPKELMAMGYLVRPRIFAPPTVDTSGLHKRAGEFKAEESESLMDTPSITGDAFSHYRKHADGLPGLAFCTSVKHAEHVAERFRREGVAAISLNGGSDKDLRRNAVADFKRGVIKIMASCDLFSEGFDSPGAHVGIMLRPTSSLGLYLQQCGRMARPAPGKAYYTLLDHVGNTQRHGMPDDTREWELTSDAVKKSKAAAPGVRVCPSCFAASPARAVACVECGLAFEVKPRQVLEERQGDLIEMTAEQIDQARRQREALLAVNRDTVKGIREIARIKKMNPGWADRVIAGRIAKRIKG